VSNDAIAVAVISPERGIHDQVAAAFGESYASSPLWTISDYPSPAQLGPLRDAPAGCIVVLDFSDPLRARSVAVELDHKFPHTTTIALYPGKPGRQELTDLMQLGIREVVSLPLADPEIAQAAMRASRWLLSRHSENGTAGSIYAFSPAKPGVGATTIAVHTAAAIARLSNQPTLLMDFDLKLGITNFLLKLGGQNSVLDAFDASPNLDKTLWDKAVSRRGMLEVLGSAPAEFGRVILPAAAADVLKFAGQHYATICVDLPGEMGNIELETLRQAKEIFLVCTPDLGTLYMAKRKADLLRSLGLGADVSVIMNRADWRSAVPVSDVEEMLRLPVRFSVSSDPARITDATARGVALEGRFPIVSQIENIARHIYPAAPGSTTGRKFIEFFSVSPVRDRFVRKH
jgi:pilus assembly protein CpaE